MPTMPEAIIAMLATVRIGAIHVAVFAGFGAGALGDRIAASGSRLVLTADITFRKGKEVRLKEIVDAALQGTATSVEHVVVLRRGASACPMKPERDIGWEEFLARGKGQSGEHVPMESNEPAFILATSGTTARPKLAVHTHGGYQVHIVSMAK
jgi:acetyl-CoA synthetase